MTKIDANERKLRAEAIRYSFVSVRMAGLEPGPEAETIARRFVEGELSREGYSRSMRKLALKIAQKRR